MLTKNIVSAYILLTIGLISGCSKEQIQKDDFQTFKPVYSLPVGSIDVLFGDMIRPYKDLLIKIPNTVDTLNTFFYENINYFNPIVFDTTVFKSFNFANLTKRFDLVKGLTFRTNSNNGIPGRFRLQIYFMDEDFVVLDSLYHQNRLVIDGAYIDENGIVYSECRLRKSDSELNADQIAMIKDIKAIGVGVSLTIENYSKSKTQYFDNQSLWLQFGVTVELELNLVK